VSKQTPLSSRLVRALILVSSLLVLAPASARAQEIHPDRYRQLEYRHIGPQGNRVVAVAGMPGDTNVLYTGAAAGGIWKSIDAGINWVPIFDDQEVTSIGSLAVAESDHEVIWAGTGEGFLRSNISIGNGIYKSTDAGKTWGRFSGGPGSGLYKSTEGGTTWERISGRGFPTTEVGEIAVAVAPTDSQRIYALIETGDGVPQEGKEVGNGVLWRSDDGGESWELINYNHILNERPHYYTRLAVAADNRNEVYFVAGTLSHSIDGGLTTERIDVWPDKHDMWMDPTNPDSMLLASDGGPIVTTNGGKTWNMTNLPIAQVHHVAVDNQIPYFVYGTRQDGPSVRGPSNALTTDGGLWGVGITAGMWQTVGGTASNIEPSRYDAGTAYITVDLHQENNRDPYVYKTADYGASWTSISSDIPRSVFSYAHVVREDPVRKGLLYLGTENGLYVSFDDGGHWTALQNNLPHAPVHWLVVQEHFNDLVVGTYGRGFWIMDDITPLQHLTPEVLAGDVHLFAPRPAYRFLYTAPPLHVVNDQSIGREPCYGASLSYYLDAAAADGVTITILQDGRTIRTIEGTTNPGINRVFWDLRYEASEQAKLRTNHAYAPHVMVDPRRQWRPSPRGGGIQTLAAPGTYTVRLTVGSEELEETLVVIKDPKSTGTEADIRAQVELSLALTEDLNEVVEMIDCIEWIRKQPYDLIAVVEQAGGEAEIVDAGKDLDDKLVAVEENLFQMKRTPGADTYRWPTMLYGRIQSLAGDLQSTNWAAGTDAPPTTQQVEVHELLRERLANYQSRLNEILGTDIPAFNSKLDERNYPSIFVTVPR